MNKQPAITRSRKSIGETNIPVNPSRLAQVHSVPADDDDDDDGSAPRAAFNPPSNPSPETLARSHISDAVRRASSVFARAPDTRLRFVFLSFADPVLEEEFNFDARRRLASDIHSQFAFLGLLMAIVVVSNTVGEDLFYSHIVCGSVTTFFTLSTWMHGRSRKGAETVLQWSIFISNALATLLFFWFGSNVLERTIKWQEFHEEPPEEAAAWASIYGILANGIFCTYSTFMFNASVFFSFLSSATATAAVLATTQDPSTILFILLANFVLLYARRRRERMDRAVFLLVRQLRQENVSLEGLQTITTGADVLSIFSKRNGKVDHKDDQPVWMISSDDLDIGRVLGEGSYGAVHLARWRGTDVAVKSIIRADSDDDKHLKDFLGEVSLLSELRHPNIVLFMGVSLDGGQALLVTEFMNGGSLFDAIHREGAFVNSRAKLSALSQAASGLAYLHSLVPPVLHGDFKTGNLLVDDRWNVKIADFGMSFVYRKGDGEDAEDAGRYGKGTLVYAAPEVLRGEALSVAADVYSLGIVMWEVSQQEVPYSELFQQCGAATISLMVLEKSLRPDVTRMRMGDGFSELMRRCWSSAVSKRPTASQTHRELQVLSQSEDDTSSRTDTMNRTVDSSDHRGSHGLFGLTVVLIEVCDSGALWGQQPQVMRRVLRDTVFPKLRNDTDELGGFVRRTGPEGALAGFSRPQKALDFAMELLSWSQRLGDDASLRIQFRIALHHGDWDGLVELSPSNLSPTRDARCVRDAATVVAYARSGELAATSAFLSAVGQEDEFARRLREGWTLSCVENTRLGVHVARYEAADGDADKIEREADELELPDWVIDPADLRTDDGASVTGRVTATAIKCKFLGAPVSAKRIDGLRTEEMQLHFFEHCSLMSSAHHPNVAQFVGGWTDRNTGYVLQRWMSRSLTEYLLTESRDTVIENESNLLLGIARGIAYLHGLGIVHRALSTSNVLLDDDGTVKVADVQPGLLSALIATRTAVTGLAIEPPEVMSGGRARKAGDVFAFSMIMYQIVVGDRPFGPAHSYDARLISAVHKGLRPLIPGNVVRGYGELLSLAWDGEPDQRPSAQEVVDRLKAIEP